MRVTATLSLERSADTELTLSIAGGTARSMGDGPSEADSKDYDPSTSLTDTGMGAVDITIVAGNTSGFADVTITPVDDRFDESDGTPTHPHETIVFSGTASGDLSVTSDTVTITDDDATSTVVTLAVDTDTVTPGEQTEIGEGDGATSVLVTATLNDAVRSTATTVSLNLSGTAEFGAGKDYSVSGLLGVTIPENEVSGQATITITPNNERIDDGDKTIQIDGDAPSGSNLGVISADEITLADNDDPPTAITLTVDPTNVREQGPAGGCPEDGSTPGSGCRTSVTITATFSGTDSDVTRLTGTDVTLSVHANSTATRYIDTNTANPDYSAPDALGNAVADITIPDGGSSATTEVVFTSLQDNTAEGDETIIIDGAATIDIDGTETALTINRATIDLSDDDSPSTSLTLRIFECVIATGLPPDTERPDYCPSDQRPVGLTTQESRSFNEGKGAVELIVEAGLDGDVSSNPTDVTLKLEDMVTGRKIATGGGKDYTASDNLTDTGMDAVDITISATEPRAMTKVTLTFEAPEKVDDDDEIIRIGGTANNGITTVRYIDIGIIDNEEASTSVTLTKTSGRDSFTEDNTDAHPYTITAELGDIST